MTTSFKVYFIDEIHRISIPSATPSLAQLHHTIRTIFASQISDSSSLKIHYIDEDNDKITVSSQQEWDEALNALKDSKVKKIHLVEEKVKKAASCEAPKPRSRFPRRKYIHHEIQAEKMQDLAIQIAHGFQVDLPTDDNIKIHLKSFLFRFSLEFLENKEYTKALNVLNALLKMFPNSGVDLYNLACTYALIGDKKQACENLKKATENGYINTAHIKKDSDLDSIRGMPEYEQIISNLESKFRTINVKGRRQISFFRKVNSTLFQPELKKEDVKSEVKEEVRSEIKEEIKEEAKPEIIEETKPEIKEEIKPVEVEVPEDESQYKDQKKQLIEMGFGDVGLLEALLTAEEGDVQAVIALLMEI